MSLDEAEQVAQATRYTESILGERAYDWSLLGAKITNRYPTYERYLLAKKTRETAWQILRSFRESKEAKERGKLPALYAMDRDLQFIKQLC